MNDLVNYCMIGVYAMSCCVFGVLTMLCDEIDYVFLVISTWIC